MRMFMRCVLFVLAVFGTALGCRRAEPPIEQAVVRAEPTPSAVPAPAPKRDPEPNPIQAVPAPPDVAAPPAAAVRTPTGLAYKLLRPGRNDERPRAWDFVELAYTGWTTEGVMFATTQQREPAEMTIDRMIPAWQEIVPQMRVGERRRLWVPEALAAHGAAGMPKGMLVFDLELLELERQPRPPSPPKDVAAAPANATRTESGLAFRVLRKGRGKLHPAADSRVRIHFDGFTADGAVFESTRRRGMPDTLRVAQVITGMREALLAMVEGEKRRCWIPPALGYVERTDGPAGAIVVDLELLEIVPNG